MEGETALKLSKKPNITQEEYALSMMSDFAEVSYIKERLAQIGSDLMNTRYERDADVDATIAFLKDRQEKAESKFQKN